MNATADRCIDCLKNCRSWRVWGDEGKNSSQEEFFAYSTRAQAKRWDAKRKSGTARICSVCCCFFGKRLAIKALPALEY